MVCEFTNAELILAHLELCVRVCKIKHVHTVLLMPRCAAPDVALIDRPVTAPGSYPDCLR